MKFGKKSAGAIVAGLSLVMALSPVAAFAEDGPAVNKTLQLNTGSTVTATFGFNIQKVQLNTSDNTTNAEGATVDTNGDDTALVNDVPDIVSSDSKINGDGSKTGTTDNKGTSAIALKQGESFPHAGIYAWKVTEKDDTYRIAQGSNESMAYDKQVYTVIATVNNKSDGTLAEPTWKVVKGDTNTTGEANIGKKVGSLDFTNTYVETPSNTKDGTDLTITKTVEGDQADKTAKNKFHFVVTFSEPTYKNDWKLADIAATGANVSKTSDGVFEFDAANGESVSFKNVPVGATYKVKETQKAGFEGTYYVNGSSSATATGEKGADVTADNVAITEGTANSGEMKNSKEDTPVTGLIVNNAPFVITIAVAAAGAVAYGAAKRKLEK